MRLNAVTHQPYNPAHSALKRDRLRAHRHYYRCAHQDYWRFTYWTLKIAALQAHS